VILGKRVVVVMPAYNAEKTLAQTVTQVDRQIVDEIVLVDDHSQDDTAALARQLGLHTIRHERNLGYGGNQKSCYAAALKLQADIVVMVHPDYQYTPRLIPVLASALAVGEFDVALGSRILSGGAIKGGMPRYKYIANRLLTLVQNLFTGMKLSEYHTGYRAFTREVLQSLTFEHNSDDFVFDNEMLMQIDILGFRIAEVTCPTRYFAEASSIGLRRSMRYGMGCLFNTALHVLCRLGWYRAAIFRPPPDPPGQGRPTGQ
jgi:glycosyltransferase involved in cell wall biosynthesis